MAKRRPTRRRTSSSDGPLTDQPWWVRTIVWVGVPTAAFGVLLWFLLGQFERQQIAFEQHVQDSAELVEHLQEESDQGWQMVGILQRVCLNTARTDEDRMACVTLPQRPPQ